MVVVGRCRVGFIEVVDLGHPGDPPAGDQVWGAPQSVCPHHATGLRDWSNPATWPNGEIPAADGRNVTLPAGTKVRIAGCSLDESGVYGKITVPEDSALIFADAPISLHTTGIEVLTWGGDYV